MRQADKEASGKKLEHPLQFPLHVNFQYSEITNETELRVLRYFIKIKRKLQKLEKTLMTQWPECASELYPSSDRRLSERLVSTFADIGMLRGQRGGTLRP
jgi:hypothetical protein